MLPHGAGKLCQDVDGLGIGIIVQDHAEEVRVCGFDGLRGGEVVGEELDAFGEGGGLGCEGDDGGKVLEDGAGGGEGGVRSQDLREGFAVPAAYVY